jgi:hypothetical protein
MATQPRFTFNETEQHALRLVGWRVLPEKADRAWSGEIVATIKATGRWSVTEHGDTVAIGAGESPVLSALEALQAAMEIKRLRLLGRLA